MTRQSYYGLMLVTLATMSYAVCNILLKAVEADLSDGTAVFYRFFFALLMLVPTFYFKRSLSLKTKKFKWLFLRASSGFLMIICWAYALKFLPAANVILLSNTAPLFVPLLLFILCRQSIALYQVAILTIGFLGVLCILHPSYGTWLSYPALIGLLSGLSLAIGLIIINRLATSEPSSRIVIYFYLIGICYSLIFFKVTITGITLHEYLLLLGVAASATLYQLLITRSLAHLPPTVIAPMLYLAVAFGCIGDYLLWDIVPTHLFTIGLILIFISALLNTFCHKIHSSRKLLQLKKAPGT